MNSLQFKGIFNKMKYEKKRKYFFGDFLSEDFCEKLRE